MTACWCDGSGYVRGEDDGWDDCPCGAAKHLRKQSDLITSAERAVIEAAMVLVDMEHPNDLGCALHGVCEAVRRLREVERG